MKRLVYIGTHTSASAFGLLASFSLATTKMYLQLVGESVGLLSHLKQPRSRENRNVVRTEKHSIASQTPFQTASSIYS